MKTKVIYLMLTLMAVFACVSLSSCGSDDNGTNSSSNYYMVMKSVYGSSTKAVNIGNTLISDWKNNNNVDSQGILSLGTSDEETAKAMFSTKMNTLRKQYDDAYAGKNQLNDKDYVLCVFVVCSNTEIVETKSINVSNSGAEFVE